MEWGPSTYSSSTCLRGPSASKPLRPSSDVGRFVVVTIPPTSRIARSAIRRSGAHSWVPILGIVENMSAYKCAHCHQNGPLFAGDAADRLAEDAGAPILDRVPFDSRLQSKDGSGTLEGGRDALATAGEALVARLEAR